MLIFLQKADYKRPEYLFIEPMLFEDSLPQVVFLAECLGALQIFENGAVQPLGKRLTTKLFKKQSGN